MEKYSRWRDSGTGIQPFLPPVPSRQESNLFEAIGKILSFLIKPVLGLAKFLLVILAALLLFLIVDVLGLLLIKVKMVYRVYHYLFTCLLARIALFFMGFYWIRTERVSLRRGRVNTLKSRGAFDSTRLKSGDVIVSNWTSYVELIYLAFRYDPVFTEFYVSTNTLRPISLWTAIKITGQYPELNPPSGVKTYSITELSKLAKSNDMGPIVVFPEATTSNGRALLKFNPVFRDLSLPVEDFQILILNVKYEYENFSPTYTAGNKFWHFLRLCSEFKNQMNVKFLAADESPSSSSFTITSTATLTPYSAARAATLTHEDQTGYQIINLVGQMSRLRKTNLGVQDKCDFLEYYWERTNYNAVRDSIKQILPQPGYDDGSTGPVLVRLAWHAAGTYDMHTNTGGSNGATMRFAMEASDPANAGLEYARKFLEPIKHKFPWISYADLWTLAGVVAIEEMGGPVVPWKPGRTDKTQESDCPPNGRLPDAAHTQQHIRDVFYRMGFTDREIVALMGAHTIGRCHKDRSGYDGPWTYTPTRFSNQLDEDDELMMLPADMALIIDPKFREIVNIYAQDKKAFFNDFASAFGKLLELGVTRNGNDVAKL
ncbi:1029_t:CDS:10 [Ambispora leptoticha]|uniref:Peroxidase n=1 Tax=Ambispora leptoticha TaxID=144679 RepID=A0A9N8VPS5_9GLOM|nr:1029_t:CDS:10 [Ambispora leptoticha]